jgi:hypothetical protein
MFIAMKHANTSKELNRGGNQSTWNIHMCQVFNTLGRQEAMGRITYLAASLALSSRVPLLSGMVKYTMSRFNSNLCNL